MQPAYYLKKIKEDFSRRQRGNSAYSLRAYARDLGIPPSTLSQVLLGNRSLPLKNVDRVLKCIKLTAKERTLFFDSLSRKNLSIDQIQVRAEDDRFILDESHYQVIAEWEHYAALTLFDCAGFKASVESIAEKLGVSRVRAEVVTQNLLRTGLLSQPTSGKLARTHAKIRTTEDTSSQALAASHRENLQIGERKLREIDLMKRDFSALVVAIDPAKMPEAKAIIREFRRKMTSLLETGTRSEVYQLAIQFYPLTRNTQEKK